MKPSSEKVPVELYEALNALKVVFDQVLVEKTLEQKLREAQANGEIILARILERKLQAARSDTAKSVVEEL